MNNQVLKARYTTTHNLVVVMNGNWTMKKDVIRKYNVIVPDFAAVKAVYNENTDTTVVTFSWCAIDESPEYMMQP